MTVNMHLILAKTMLLDEGVLLGHVIERKREKERLTIREAVQQQESKGSDTLSMR